MVLSERGAWNWMKKRFGLMMSSLRDFVGGEERELAVALRYTAGYA
jgi:hypothetical protein